jgi:hypothetical protein
MAISAYPDVLATHRIAAGSSDGKFILKAMPRHSARLLICG